jgi:hypothetical protein
MHSNLGKRQNTILQIKKKQQQQQQKTEVIERHIVSFIIDTLIKQFIS